MVKCMSKILLTLLAMLVSAGSANAQVWEKVKSDSQLQDGKRYLLVNESEKIAMEVSSYDKEGRRHGVSVEIQEGGKIANVPDNVAVIRLEKEGSYWGLYCVNGTSGYLTLEESGKTGVSLFVKSNLVKAGKTTITIADGNANIEYAKVKFDARYLQSYGARKIFYVYNNTFRNSVQLYVESDGSTPVDPVKQEQHLSFGAQAYEVRLGQDFVAPVLEGAKTAVTYSSQNTSVAQVDASTGKVVIRGVGHTQIVAQAAESEEYHAASASYELTVKDNTVNPGDAQLPLRQSGGVKNLGKSFQANLDESDYGDSEAALKFSEAGHSLLLELTEAPASLSYMLKSHGMAGRSRLEVAVSADGVTYEPLKTYIGNTWGREQLEVHLPLKEDTRFIRWEYVNKDASWGGNVGLGSIFVTAKGDVLSESVDLSAGKATFSSDQVVLVPEGVRAQYVAVDGKRLQLSTAYEAGMAVPANTPVLLSGAAGVCKMYTTNVPAKSVQGVNDLRSSLYGDEIKATGNTKLYILADDPIHGLGFYYQGKDGDGSKVYGLKHKAYLEVAHPAAANGFSLDGDVLGVVSGVKTERKEPIFSLSGVRMGTDSNRLPKGIYIIGGKKYLVK